MAAKVKLGDRMIGDGEPVYIIGEIGINHNGDIDVAKKLIDAAALSGADAVKFQKRTPEICVPKDQWDIERDTPWGRMTYMEYRHRVEFDADQYAEIDRYCKDRGIDWFASCWDEPSVDFIEQFDPVCYKVASACITDEGLVKRKAATGKPIILSTGMSELQQIEQAVSWIEDDKLMLTHTTSTYPCPSKEINLKMIPTLKDRFQVPVGYSGHEVGLQISVASVAYGACIVERHITIDRTMWGSDQAASVEPHGLMRLVRDIRIVEEAAGDGIKKVYESEVPIRKKLRRIG